MFGKMFYWIGALKHQMSPGFNLGLHDKVSPCKGMVSKLMIFGFFTSDDINKNTVRVVVVWVVRSLHMFYLSFLRQILTLIGLSQARFNLLRNTFSGLSLVVDDSEQEYNDLELDDEVGYAIN